MSAANAPVPPAPDERRQLTVVFTDLVGSTELAAALDPEDWHEVLDAYQHRVASIVTSHGGVIAQFQGDGAVAYFGYPEAVESAGRDSVAAGLAVVEEMARLGAEFPGDLGIGELQARAGIHTGEVVVAAVTAGGNERLPDLWGQVPNLAARLQAVAEPGQVVISGDTASLVSGYFEVSPLGALSLKGFAEPVPAFRVLRRSAARHRLEARPLTGFVSRSDALAWLGSEWDDAAKGAARLALVMGEPGIGKSRLLLEFSSGLAARGHTVRAAYCSRRGSLSPLQPFADVLGNPPATPMEVDAWAEDLTRSGPLLLMVEDAHWADPSTLEAVHLIARPVVPGAGCHERTARDRRRSQCEAVVAPDPRSLERRGRARAARSAAAHGRIEATCPWSARREGGRSAALPRRTCAEPGRGWFGSAFCGARDALRSDHGAARPGRRREARGAVGRGDRADVRTASAARQQLVWTTMPWSVSCTS